MINGSHSAELCINKHLLSLDYYISSLETKKTTNILLTVRYITESII